MAWQSKALERALLMLSMGQISRACKILTSSGLGDFDGQHFLFETTQHQAPRGKPTIFPRPHGPGRQGLQDISCPHRSAASRAVSYWNNSPHPTPRCRRHAPTDRPHLRRHGFPHGASELPTRSLGQLFATGSRPPYQFSLTQRPP